MARSVEYIRNNLGHFLKKNERVLICFPKKEDACCRILEQAVLDCDAVPDIGRRCSAGYVARCTRLCADRFCPGDIPDFRKNIFRTRQQPRGGGEMIKILLILASFLPMLIHSPYLYQAWTGSRLDHWDWIFYLISIPAAVWAARAATTVGLSSR